MARPLTIVVAERIKVPAMHLPPMLQKKLTERLVFTNPEYELRQSRGEWLGNIPPQIRCLYEQRQHYYIPRGFLHQLLELCDRYQVPYRLVDRQRTLEPVEFSFHGILKEYQEEAVEAMLTRDHGTLVGDAKSGKTVIALSLISRRRQPTMVLVPNVMLLHHWREKLERFLNLPAAEIGMIGEGKFELGPRVTVAQVSAMYRRVREVRDRVGMLVVDECHRTPSRTFTQVVSNFDCRYLVGLASTTPRRDRLTRLIYYYLGDILHQIDRRDATEHRALFNVEVVVRETEFYYPYEGIADYQKMIAALAADKERNALIVTDVEEAVKDSPEHAALVVTADDEQAQTLEGMLHQRGVETVALTAAEQQEGMEAPRLAAAVSKGAVVLASVQVLGEVGGRLPFDLLFLTTPLNFKGEIVEKLQVILTQRNGRPPVKVYDYVDKRVSVLDNLFRTRSYVYGLRLQQPPAAGT